MTILKAKELGKLNAEKIETEKVQYWLDSGTMAIAQMPKAEAIKMVVSGKAFVISEQAIGEIVPRKLDCFK